jgi:hypothetical protein
LPHSPDDATITALQRTHHTPMGFHRASFGWLAMDYSTRGVTPCRRSRCARPWRIRAFSAALIRLVTCVAISPEASSRTTSRWDRFSCVGGR